MRGKSAFWYGPAILMAVLTVTNSRLCGENPGVKKRMAFVREFSLSKDPTAYATALQYIGQKAHKEPDRLAAMRFFREILSSRRYHPVHCYAWLELSRFYSGSNREAILLRALQRSPDDYSQAVVLSKLIQFYDQQNQPEVKKLYLQRLVNLAESTRDIPNVAAVFRDLGMMELRKLDAFSALRHFIRALDFPNEPEVVGEVSLGAAVALGMLNKPGLQERFFRRALDNAQKWRMKSLKIRALSRYSQTLLENARNAEAMRLVDMSIREERELGHYVCLRDSLFRRGLILEQLNQLSAMEKSLTEAVESALKNRDYVGLFPVMAYLADALISGKELVKSGDLLRRIDDLFAPYHPHYFLFHYLQGRLAQANNHMVQADAAYTQAVLALRRNLPSFAFGQRSFWRYWLDSLYSRMIRFRLKRFSTNGDAAALENAIRLHEEKNELLARCIVYRGSKELSLQREEEYLQQQFTRILARSKEFNSSERLQEQLHRLRKQIREIRELTIADPPLSMDLDAHKLNLTRFRQYLRPDQVAVKFMLLENQVAVVTLGRKCFRFRYLGSDRDTLIRDIMRLSEPLNDFARGRVDYLRVHFDLPLALSLYKRLLLPLQSDLEGITELIVIPEKELFHLPFDALVSGFVYDGDASAEVFSEYAAAEYLGQRFQLSLAFSLTLLNRRFQKSNPHKMDLVAFSGPLVQNHAHQSFSSEFRFHPPLSPLPSSVTEVHRIARFFSADRIRLFSGEAFTIANFRRQAPGARIVHLATHYIPNLASPWHSGLLFSPDSSDPGGSVLLRANDAQHIPLQAELLVLSACESADQRILGLTGLAGMAAAFSQNGVRSALVSMWPVDEISSRVLPLFYRHYLGHGRASQALRRAKLEFMQSNIQLADGRRMAFAHPFFWSNFQLLRFRN
ncbi:MAG TPA: CHAT domain-containing protein [Candidatus Aminicenantes bacterium]|nr:CHAT domain-containing protein [Candidatus Aminicenantes bacterium]